MRDWTEAADPQPMTFDVDPAHWEAEESLRAALAADALEDSAAEGHALNVAMTTFPRCSANASRPPFTTQLISGKSRMRNC